MRKSNVHIVNMTKSKYEIINKYNNTFKINN